MPRLSARRWRDDRGAVAVTVAFILAGGVLLGFGAVVVDVGWLYIERTQLQSGADAATVGVAKACGQNTADCGSIDAARALADRLADDNAPDGEATILDVCGLDQRNVLPACVEPTSCYGGRPSPPTNFVEIVVATGHPESSSTLLPPTFARALAGNSDSDGVEVRACSRAEWNSAPVVVAAMTVSTCEFASATDGGTDFARRPPYPPDPAFEDQYTIYTRGSNVHGSCSTRRFGWGRAGPFGWLDSGGDCRTTVPTNRVMTGITDNGSAPPDGCAELLQDARDHKRVIYLVVHDARRTRFGPLQFRAAALAPFVVTGFYYPDANQPSWADPDGELPCSGFTDRCISGFFIGPTVPITYGGDTAAKIVG
jgi:hypothetical protein